jgi:hypothetical protein
MTGDVTAMHYDLPWPSALARSTATPEVTGSRPTFGGISEIIFSSRYSLWHGL